MTAVAYRDVIRYGKARVCVGGDDTVGFLGMKGYR